MKRCVDLAISLLPNIVWKVIWLMFPCVRCNRDVRFKNAYLDRMVDYYYWGCKKKDFIEPEPKRPWYAWLFRV